MRYAIISDIHGNYFALNAVLEDCKKQHIDKYLFLGDYYGEFPMPNEVISKIKEIDNSYAIKGNKEQRLVDYYYTSHEQRTSEQLAPLFWNLKNINNSSYEYIESLPETLSFEIDNTKFFMAHSPSQHFEYGVIDSISGLTFINEFGMDYTNHSEYLHYIKNKIQTDLNFINTLSDKTDGIYLFGHYHTQWHTRINNKLLINPGSCGMPNDFDTSAPYTVLDTNGFSIIERRVQYDIKMPVQFLKESDYYRFAPFWCKLSIMEFENAKVTAFLFLEFVEELAKARNDTIRPYSNTLWREAISLYEKTH
ncbi:metallophosphoesterase family protein [Clostridium hydrogenum]|uniref:metallophosphoesterase family protein n=1 Tax=Clostridium hydrogenum TaxID=2855764 RepID=UPI001F281C7D|nr:metallophosphoesterase family protein [Clostridium hydrogenum]